MSADDRSDLPYGGGTPGTGAPGESTTPPTTGPDRSADAGPADDEGPARKPSGGHWKSLDGALRDFAHAIKSMQLYPEGSPVVQEALQRALDNLQPVVARAALIVDVLPNGMRVDKERIGEGSPTIQQLASRLHHRGVARLIVDDEVDTESLRRLAELVATDRETLDARGGFEAVLVDQPLPGIKAEFLELQRLFEAARGNALQLEVDTVWDTLLSGFEEHADVGNLTWERLAVNPDQLRAFLEWMIEHGAESPQLAAYSHVDLLRLVYERIGEVAASLGEEQLGAIILAVRELHEQLDPEAWIELLSEPLVIEAPDVAATDSVGAEQTATDGVGAEQTGTDGDGPAAPGSRRGATGGGRRGNVGPSGSDAGGEIDLSQRLAQELEQVQVEDLLLYSVRTRKGPSPRLLEMFSRVLEERPDRDAIAEAVERRVGEEIHEGRMPSTVVENWGNLGDVLLGEDIEPYVSSRYRATMDTLWQKMPAADLWPIERIRQRQREMDDHYLLCRKCRILASILSLEYDDRDYLRLAKEIEAALPELIAHDEYELLCDIVGRFAQHRLPETGRGKQQRRLAEKILRDFSTEEQVVQIVRSLIGKNEEQVQIVMGMFEHLESLAIPALLEGLAKEHSRQARSLLLRMLTAMGEQALGEIEGHLRDQRWFFVRNLVWIIGEVGDPQFAHHLAGPSRHPDARVRREAVRALAKIGGDEATSILLRMIDDSEAAVRLVAIRGLGHCGSKLATDELLKLLDLPNWRGQNSETIKAAAIALGRLGDERAIPRLEGLAASPWLFRKRRRPATEAARWALQALRGEVDYEDVADERMDGRDDPMAADDEDPPVSEEA